MRTRIPIFAASRPSLSSGLPEEAHLEFFDFSKSRFYDTKG